MNIKRLYKSQDIWSIGVYVDGKLREVFTPKHILRTRYHYITGYADPFLFCQDGWLYLFYEEERLEAPAALCGLRTKDLEHWEHLGIILKEPFHLSYPNVFEFEGHIYMMPECRSTHTVKLYQAIEFPYRWESVNLLENGLYADSSVQYIDGKWYLFTTNWVGENHLNGNELQLYVCDRLDGGYQLHPKSPITTDLSNCRCGGSLVEIKGQLYRPAQDCSSRYGGDLVLYRVEKISPLEYEETKTYSVIDKEQIWSQYGGHQYNKLTFKGHLVEVMDGIGDDNWVNNHTRKFFNFWHRHISCKKYSYA